MSIWAFVLAVVSTFVLGFLWYSPFMFHKAWCRENGVPEDYQAGHPAKVFGISAIFALAAVGAYAHLVGFSDDIGASALQGAAIGAGFAATSFGINYQFAGRSLKLWLIDGGYHTVQFALYGAILAAFH
ncbi:MAG: DUF1761 domain-containing protein [Xanthomonadales bacterium]|nr:DUF1761 domain-containing protein [Xanthomonadales bacterium]